MATAGGIGGIAVAEAFAEFWRRIPIPFDLPVVFDIGVDQRVLLFTLIVSMFSTLLFGLAPAFQMTRPELVPSLKASDADSGGGRRLWGRNMIVAGQVALSLVLLAVAATLVQAFRDELTQGPGFRTDHLYITSFDTQLARYSEDQTRRFWDDLLRRTRSAAGVRSAALVSNVPMIGIDNLDIVVDGFEPPGGKKPPATPGAYISDGYFRSMGIPIVAGRDILESDREQAPLVALVNEHLAKHYWPKGDAVGKRFHLGTTADPLIEIVGIAKSSKVIWIGEPPMDFVYLPFRQHPRSQMSAVVESFAQDAATLAPVLRDVVHNLDPDMPVFDVRTMHDFYSQRAVKTPNIITQVVVGLGLMGLTLAVMGLYGLVAYSVSRRTREIGIRIAIGANSRQVVWMVLHQALQLGAAGTAVGLVVSFFVCRVATTGLVTLKHVDPLIFVTLPVLLLAVIVLAAWAPARRASLVDPLRALRDE